MTTKQDWEFRRDYLRDYAKYLRAEADKFEKAALETEETARIAERNLLSAIETALSGSLGALSPNRGVS